VSRIDAHHHLWDPAVRDYPWMAPKSLAPLRRRYDLADLRPHLRATGVSATIVVQSVDAEDETVQLLQTALDSDGLIAGVIGWVDVSAQDVTDRLAALAELPGGHLLVGIRHLSENEPDSGWLARPEVISGVRAVTDAGLVFDLLVGHRQWGAALALVGALDGAPMVLDHAGKPPLAGGELGQWRGWIENMAAHPHLSIKLSGLVTEADWASWTVADLKPVAESVLDSFGPSRIMAGSDWPVCELAANYESVWGALDNLLAGHTSHVREQINSRTAETLYLRR
jgi:L-fuconolactonase